jgi:hypothetical protein
MNITHRGTVYMVRTAAENSALRAPWSSGRSRWPTTALRRKRGFEAEWLLSDFRSSVDEAATGRRDTLLLVNSPIGSEAWIAQGKGNGDERVAPFIENEFDPAEGAAKELVRGWSIVRVCKLDATGRTGPGMVDQHGADAAGPMSIFERATRAACEQVPAFERLTATQHGGLVDEGLVTLRTHEVRSRRLRCRRKHRASEPSHLGGQFLGRSAAQCNPKVLSGRNYARNNRDRA